jgi:hypothetical protein
LVREVTKNLIVTLTELEEFLCGDERTFQKDNHLCSTPLIRPLWYSGQMEATPQKKAHDSPLGVCQKVPK